MEQSRYWMWTRKKFTGRTHVQATTSSDNNSWEEQAFAEDSAGVLGGCIWPPRSYSCSFCRREFRSAQALGGHMNVHRRDRARLKQSPNSHVESQHQSPYTQLDVQYPSQVRTMFCNSNPNPNHVQSVISSSRVSTSSAQDNCIGKALVSPYSSLAQEHPNGSLISPPPSIPTELLGLSHKLKRENSVPGRMVSRARRDYVKPNSALGSPDLVWSLTQQTDTDGDIEEAAITTKRRKIDVLSPFFIESNKAEGRRTDAFFPLVTRPSSGERHHFQSEILGLGSRPMEELDLELRLGDRPKVK